MTRPTAIFIFICLALCGFVHGNDPTADAIEKISETVDVQALNETAFKQVAELKNKLKNKCEKNGHPESYDKIMVAKDEVMNCMKNLMNVTELQDEIEKAKPRGNLDIVFGKYCKKNSTLMNCMTNLTDTFEPCLDPPEVETTRILLNLTNALLNFICYKDGDRIALFIAAGGPECFQSKQTALQECLNATYGGYIPVITPDGAPPSLENLPLFTLGLKECRDMESFQGCAVKALEECEDPTPGNVADALFTFVKKMTPCEHLLDGPIAARSADATAVKSSASVISTFHSLIFLLITMTIRYV